MRQQRIVNQLNGSRREVEVKTSWTRFSEEESIKMSNVDLGNIAQIAKFEGKNYQQWKFQVKCALRAKGLYGIADGSTPKPEVFAEGELWNKKDAQAMCIITAAMGLNQISLIENCETSKQVLDKLNSIYDVKTETNKMLVHEQFYQYKMLPTDSMA